MASTPPPDTTNPHYYHALTQQQTMPLPAVPNPLLPAIDAASPTTASTSQWTFKRILPIVIALALVIVMYFVWKPSTPTPPSTGSSSSVTQQNFGNTVTTKSSTVNGDIQVYVVGAVKHPGVYT